jgi:hypothetical protein
MRDVRAIPIKRVSSAYIKVKRKWRYIIIHHSAGTRGDAESIGNYHRKIRRWRRGLGYHFVVGNGTLSRDGEIEAGPRWRRQQSGAHAGVNKYNREGIGICLVGNFDKKPPSARQLAALRDLVHSLCRRYNIPLSRVKGHCGIKRTNCPGRRFPMEAFRSEVKRLF